MGCAELLEVPEITPHFFFPQNSHYHQTIRHVAYFTYRVTPVPV